MPVPARLGFPIAPRPSKGLARPSQIIGPGDGLLGGDLLAAPTIRYVRKTGSDSNGGTTPSDAWLTIGKALTTVASNTWVYVGAGVYREVVTVTITPTSEVRIIGDVDGWRTGDAGMVQWTGYTTSDTATPSGTALLNLNGKSFLTFQNLMFVSGSASWVTALSGSSTSVAFTDCSFVVGATGALANCINVTVPYGTRINWTFDRCVFMRGSGAAMQYTLTRGGAGDYDANVLIRNSAFLGGVGLGVFVGATGAGASLGGGIRLLNCLGLPASTIVQTGANVSTSVPCEVRNSALLMTGNTGAVLLAATLGQIIEDYNLIQAGTPRTNVAVGAHSVADGSYAPLFHFGQEQAWGGTLRRFGEPMAGSPLLAFGASNTAAGLIDLRKGPRPSIASRFDVGPIQRGNNYVQTTSVTQAGGNAITVLGNGFQDFDVAVDAGQVTLSIFIRYDSSYQGPLPRLQIVNGEQIGVSPTEVNADSAALNAFAQYSVTVNPTAAGILTFRVISADTSGVGNVYADTFAAA